MFSKKLSSALLNLCDSRELSYETASELCNMSSRYFGSIARGQTAPSINTLEKICLGLDQTPNDLLGFTTADEELSYRFSMQVIHYNRYVNYNGKYVTFPVCPRCHNSIEREYQAFCDRCEQKLNWNVFKYAVLYPK